MPSAIPNSQNQGDFLRPDCLLIQTYVIIAAISYHQLCLGPRRVDLERRRASAARRRPVPVDL